MDIRLAKPEISARSKELVRDALDQGRVSEGLYTRRLEGKIAELLGAKHCVMANSGHSALVMAFSLSGRKNYDSIVTTSLTFISTISAARQAGLKVFVVDTEKDGFLMQVGQAEDLLGPWTLFVPVHLFGYPVANPGQEFQVQDACEAFGTRSLNATDGVSCFSFYTSHVGGCGEAGCVVTDDPADARYLRSVKDQGRFHERQADHVEARTRTPVDERYRHRYLGYNFRTTDVQSAILLGQMEEIRRVIEIRRQNVERLTRALGAYQDRLILPAARGDVSHLAYPLIARDRELRDLLVRGLEEAGIETRSLMSLIPRQEACRGEVSAPFGFENAASVHERGFYVTCRENLSGEELGYVEDTFRRLLA